MAKRDLVYISIIIILAAALAFTNSPQSTGHVVSDAQAQETVIPGENAEALVSRIVDGDTIVLSTGEYIRLIGIDTPEKGQPGYLEAKSFLASMVEGKTVTLESDVEDKDKYGRLLRYIYIDDIFVNRELVVQGYAKTLSIEPSTRYKEVFAQAQAEAQDAGLGIWKDREVYCLSIFSFNYNAAGNDNENLNGEYVTFRNACTERLLVNGWKLHDSQGNEYLFAGSIAGKEKLTLHTGSGADTREDVYWNQDRAIWANSGDTLTVWDTNGEKVLEYSYPE